MNINEEIGQRIKNRRIEIGMTQFELAQKLGYSGKSKLFVRRNCKSFVNAIILIRIVVLVLQIEKG